MNTLVRFLFRMPVKDASGAYRCYRVSKLRETRLDKVRSRGYSFQQEVLFRCHKAGCKLGEYPIIFENRRAGVEQGEPQGSDPLDEHDPVSGCAELLWAGEEPVESFDPRQIEVTERRTMSRNKWSYVVAAAICILLYLLLISVFSFRTTRVTEAWSRSLNSTKQIALALNSYYDANGHLPPATVCDKEGRPLYSWRVVILPFLEEDYLYREFRLSEPWDSPHNEPLLRKMPRCFAPHPTSDRSNGLTRFQVFVGPGTAFERPGLTWSDFPDGVENTLLVVEAGEPVPWAKPGDLAYDPAGPLPRLGAGYTKPPGGFRLSHRGREGFAACFADGSVQFLLTSNDESLLRAMITRNGRERVDRSRLE